MTRRKANILLATVLLLSFYVKAQHRYTAMLDTVKATGFYHITVTPELSSYLKADLSDLTILDENKQTVPYIVDIASEKQLHPDMLPFSLKIIKNETSGSKTTLLTENTDKGLLSFFTLEIKNADAERMASLSGSDDSNRWFAVVDSLLLEKPTEKNNNIDSQKINFPLCNYKYLKLTINNGNKEPLNIIDVSSPGYNTSLYKTSSVFINPVPAFSQIDSGEYSLIKITNLRPFHISTIKFTIKGPWLYKRTAKLFTEIRSGLEPTWNSPEQAMLTISSDEFYGYTVPLFKAEVFYLLIKNGDNPPLKIASVTTEQNRRKVLTQLEAGVSYSLLLDNPDAMPREYDLQQFRDSIPDSTAITIKKITALPKTEAVAPNKQGLNRWIWPAILLIVSLLALLSWKLTADMKKKRN